MKPRESQLHFPVKILLPLHVFFPANRERLVGVQGGGNEPPGRRRTRRNLPQDARPLTAATNHPRPLPPPFGRRGLVLLCPIGPPGTLSGCTRLFGLRLAPARPSSLPSFSGTPRRPFVRASSIGTSVSTAGSPRVRRRRGGRRRRPCICSGRLRECSRTSGKLPVRYRRCVSSQPRALPRCLHRFCRRRRCYRRVTSYQSNQG